MFLESVNKSRVRGTHCLLGNPFSKSPDGIHSEKMKNERSVLTRERLDALYEKWNRPEYISPDPLETLGDYSRTADREVVAILAASMAYGRVKALLIPLKKVLSIIGSSPAEYVRRRREDEMVRDLDGIVHRFARAEHFAAFLVGIGSVLDRYGSLEASFLKGYKGGSSEDGGGDCQAGLKSLEMDIRAGAAGEPGYLLIDPAKGSACKRLYLFLRWMVRRDSVDPGGWNSVSPADLMLPLDTWTYRIALRAGWTTRRTADIKTVREVTAALGELNPQDPVRYDFALSRFGIRSGLNLDQLFADLDTGIRSKAG